MASLDTHVDGDPDSVRSAADGIGALAGGLDGAGDGFGSAASLSEAQWSGSAGDAFRGRITSAAQATRLAATAAHRVRDATHTFADRMADVRAKMKQAESIASGAGLAVSGDDITAPTPPAAPPSACYTPSGAAQVAAKFGAEVAHYRKQVAAYRKAEQIVKQARQEETEAHTELRQANDDAENLLTELKDGKYWIAGDTALSTAERGLEQAEKWEKKADHYTDRFNNLVKELPTLPEDTEARLARLTTVSNALDDVVKSGDAADANRVLALGLDSRYGKFLSGAGYALSAAELVKDALNPKDRAQNIAGDVASTAVGAGASEVIGELSVGGALETGGLSLLAGGAAIGTGYAVKHYGPSAWDWASRQAGSFVSGLGHALNPVNLLP